MSNLIYRITADQIAAAEQAEWEFAAMQADDPTVEPPTSFRQMILNEANGWTWNPTTRQYELDGS